jgi:polysaccharide pyruvyl transferase WcaK-like protein
MPAHVVLIGGRLTMNFGAPSLVLGAVRALSRFLPGARFTLMPQTAVDGRDFELARSYGIALLPWPSAGRLRSMRLLGGALVMRLTGLATGPPPVRSLLNTLSQADLVLDAWGIAFADSLGRNTFRSRFLANVHYAIVRILGPPLAKYTADLGPFRRKWNRRAARFYLNLFADMILARDQASREALREIGIRGRLMVCPDSAFLVEPSESEASRRIAAVRASRPVVGISVSFQARDRAKGEQPYVEVMARLVDHMAEQYHAYVLIIPNELNSAGTLDRSVAAEVQQRATSRDCEVVDAEGLRPEELKGVMGECDAVVAARYHAVVACLSMGVPTLAIGWHHKYRGVLALFGQESFVCDVENLGLADVQRQFGRLWSQRESVRRRILDGLPAVRDGVYAGAAAVCSLVTDRA